MEAMEIVEKDEQLIRQRMLLYAAHNEVEPIVEVERIEGSVTRQITVIVAGEKTDVLTEDTQKF